MTYIRVPLARHGRNLGDADVSHLAELVRGDFLSGRKVSQRRAPSSGPSGQLLPKRRRGAVARLEFK